MDKPAAVCYIISFKHCRYRYDDIDPENGAILIERLRKRRFLVSLVDYFAI